jgi:hypothetical protein
MNFIGALILLWGGMYLFFQFLPRALEWYIWFYERKYKLEIERDRNLRIAEKISSGDYLIRPNPDKRKGANNESTK